MKGNDKAFEARRKPRIEKVQYLLHLKDCFESAKADIQRNLSQLEEIDQYLISLARLNPEIHHNTFRKEIYKDDFTYLQNEMKDFGEAIEELQNEERLSVGERIKLTWLVDREAERTKITEHDHAHVSSCCVCSACFRHRGYLHPSARGNVASCVG